MDEQTILRHIARQSKQTAGFKQLVRELGARTADQRRDLADRLKGLTKRGELREATRDQFSIPAKQGTKGLVSGRLRMHSDGFGFVTPAPG